jgi:16S rRNA (uracil1498-N3)-methyltransferase
VPRFFKEDFKDNPFLEGEDASHISRSLRMRPGEKITVSDGNGKDFYCVIKSVESQRVELEVLKETENITEPDIEVTLCTSLLKGDKFEQVIKHSVELGASFILPVISENCVSRPDQKSLKAKTLRWQKIADEAAGQSSRGKLPEVKEAVTLKALSEKFSDYDLVLFCYEAGGNPIGETFWENDKAKKIAIITGPEGGFSKAEAQMLEGAGAKVITLGKRILRAETAPLAALTAVMLLTDNLE